MLNIRAVLKELQGQRDDVQRQINQLDSAISTLSGLNHAGQGRRGGRRNLSAAARNRIAAAQKKRWAKWKAAHKK
jgi:hypothetical protein